MRLRRLLYRFGDGTTEVLDVIPNTRGNTRRMHRAHFVLDLDTGEVLKDRYAGSSGNHLSEFGLDSYRKSFDNERYQIVTEHFEEDLFTL